MIEEYNNIINQLSDSINILPFDYDRSLMKYIGEQHKEDKDLYHIPELSIKFLFTFLN